MFTGRCQNCNRELCSVFPRFTLLLAYLFLFCSERSQRSLRSNSCILKPSYYINSSSAVTVLDNMVCSSPHSRQTEGADSACSFHEAEGNMRQNSFRHSTSLLSTTSSCRKGVEASHHEETSAVDNASNCCDQLQPLRQMEQEFLQFKLEECKLLLLHCKQDLAALERPKSKWYEMKTPEFHLEAHRQNRVLHNAAKWQRVLEGSNKLLFSEL